MSTIKALNARRINYTDYFQKWTQMARHIITQHSGPFAQDPHAFRDKAGLLQKAAVMIANQYPGNIHEVVPGVTCGQYNRSALIERLTSPESQEMIKISTSEEATPFPETIIRQTMERILAGEVMWEHMVGGQASRMKLNIEKFVLSPVDLKERYEKYYPEYLQACDKEGKTPVLPTPSDLGQIPGSMGYENAELFGVRHMLAFAMSIKDIADRMGQNWQVALSKQTVFIIANEKILDRKKDDTGNNDRPTILELFKQYGFFGLDPARVFFMASQNYDGLELTESGNLITKRASDYIHNHGAARMETTADNKWFTLEGGERKYHASETIQGVYSGHKNLQSLNIEDLDYLVRAIDEHSLSLALFPNQIVGNGVNYDMVMTAVGQKPGNPQKGGVLAYDPNFYGAGDGRLVMIEAFQAFPRFFHYMADVADKLYGNITWLNLNQNNYPNPGKLFEMIKAEGLPAWLEVKNGLLRNESPQGDANYFLNTLFVIRSWVGDGSHSPYTIKNLKDAADIPNGISMMFRQQSDARFPRLISAFVSTGMLMENLSFAHLSGQLKEIPLDISTVLAHPYLKRGMNARNREHLESLSKVFDVDGSLVYTGRIEGDNVYIKVSGNTRRGTGEKYASRAVNEVLAEDLKSRVFKENRVWSGFKADIEQSYVLVSNRDAESNEGEIVLLLGTYNENIPKEEKPVVHSEKLKKVMEYAMERGISDGDLAKLRDGFKEISWRYLFEKGATTILNKLIEDLKLGI